jgi:hypothetical protein
MTRSPHRLHHAELVVREHPKYFKKEEDKQNQVQT